MAYNPFNIFRRNQKAIFAVVTVFIMFTFVLSSGLGGGADFFDWLPRWLGAKGQRGDVVCTIDGTKVYEAELTNTRNGLRYQRVMANKYMSLAAMMTMDRLESSVIEQLNRMSPEPRQMMERILSMEQQLRNPQFAQFAAQIQQGMHDQVRQLAFSPTAKPEDKEVANAKIQSIAISTALQQAQMAGGPEQYFALAPNRTLSEMITFMLWQKKADQLGITFTTADVKILIEREFFGSFGASAQVAVQKAMAQSMPGFTMDACLKAVAEEFRVRTAQVAVLGGDAHAMRGNNFGGFPAFNTPHDAFEFFREQCSPTTYAVIPVSAADFISRIPDPNLKDPAVLNELKSLYQQFKDEEANPGKETPGFKEPRKILVNYFSVNGSEAYYTQMAAERLKLGDPIAKTGSMLTVPLFGLSPAYLATAIAPVAVKDALLEAEYELQFARMHRSEVDLRWSKSAGSAFLTEPLGLLLDTSVVRPGNLGVAAGALGGQLLGFGNPFAAAAVMGTGPIAYEIRDRARAGLPLILGALPVTGMLNTLMGGEVAYRTMVPKPLPIEAYRPTLLKELLARNARELASEDVQKFITEVNKLSENGKAKDKAAAQKFIDEFVARRGLKVEGNTVLRSEWTLEEDAALTPLLFAQREMLRAAASPHAQQQQRGYVPFGEKFFWVNNPMTRTRSPATGTLAPMYYPNERPLMDDDLKTKAQYVVWRKTEENAKPRLWSDDPNSEIYKDVVRAWKHKKARELAKAEAEKLANDIRVFDSTAEPVLLPKLRDLAVGRGEPFMIRGVAPLTTVADPTGEKGFQSDIFRPTMPTPLQPFQIRASENLRYPTNEFGRTIMDDRTKPLKTVSVLTDAPKDTYYVVTLVKREEKTDSDYKLEVAAGEFSERFGGPQVLGMFRQQSQRNAYLSVLGLLKKEFKYEATEEQKKKLEENDKRGIE
ncbi:MAG: hypothetical protein C0467_27210 [Planctomycetaceae bacterium]|nr:hypothetical protein [Planctomycetaceae bacterium]